MIEAIKEIGEYSIRKDHINTEGPEGFIEIFCQDIQGRSPKPPRILTIDLERKDNQVRFIGVSEEEYSIQKISRYLYRFGSPAGTNLTPTSMVTDIEKTYPKKFRSWFEQDFSRSPYSRGEKDLHYLNSLKNCLDANGPEIIGQIKALLREIRLKKESALVTLTVREHNQRLYLGDIELFRSIFITKTRLSFYQKYDTESVAQDQACSVCRNIKEEVYGFVSPFNFYTVDKPGMVSGGFDRRMAWKNYPVCLSCALALESGKKYLDYYSHFRLYGFDYYVIPRPLPGGTTEIYDTLKAFHTDGDRTGLDGHYPSLMSESNDEILNLLSGKENSFSCNLLFYHVNKIEFKIERYIEGIFPSRLKELFDAKSTIDAKPTLQSFRMPVFKGKEVIGERPFEFTFECIGYFFGKEIDQDARTYFLDIVSRIFSGTPVSYPFILSGITRKIRKLFARNGYTRESAVRGLALLAYLDELKLLGSYNGGIARPDQPPRIVTDASSDTEKKAAAIFSEFHSFFDTPAKRAVFLAGVLCQKLLHIQYRELNADPFRIKLLGLKLDQRRLCGLLPEIKDALTRYNANYYPDLEHLLSATMEDAGKDWRLSTDEISFCFALGMNLVDQFANKKPDNGGILDE